MRILRPQGCASLTMKGAILGEAELEILLPPAKAEKAKKIETNAFFACLARPEVVL